MKRYSVIYERDRYIWRGRFSKARFERDCLAEFAQTFPAVSVDATYYKFFERAALEELAAQVPDKFQFALKVCGDITLKQFPQLPRFGQRAGQANPHFLDAAVFTDAREVDGVRVISPLQLYLDLRALAGRGEDAAQEILEKQLHPLLAASRRRQS